MKVTTSKGKTFDVNWIDSVVNSVILEMRDARQLSKIAKDFEGCESIRRESEDQGNAEFDGYTQLVSIFRVQGSADSVQITLEKPK